LSAGRHLGIDLGARYFVPNAEAGHNCEKGEKGRCSYFDHVLSVKLSELSHKLEGVIGDRF
jgi:hypothetical protein